MKPPSDDLTVEASRALKTPSGSAEDLPLGPLTESAPTVSGYRVTQRIGEGGMGTVWLAEQLSTRRMVALKFMGAAFFGSARARSRFEREVELTARLEHPGIARVYDSGLRNGVCFFAMEYVEHGVPLDAYVDLHKLLRREMLRLMSSVCRAVQHAHERGIIHRDLKPGNILVTRDGLPKVLDFGLAKAVLDAGTTDIGASALEVSLEGDVSGTLAFMSPEQAAGRSRDADTRSDVYSLGVILYRLLTAQYPHDLAGPWAEVLKRIAETDVRRPRPAASQLDSDLEAVLLKALSHEPERRYPSAGAFADDLERHLAGDPVIARAPTLVYVLGKRVRRYRKSVAVVSTVLVLLLTAGVWSYFSIRAERDRTTAANVEKERQRAEAVRQEKLAETAATEAQVRRAEGMVSEARALTLAGLATEARARFAEAAARLQALGQSTQEARLALFDCHLRYPEEIWEVRAHVGQVAGSALLPDGRTAVTAGWDGKLLFHELPTGQYHTFGNHDLLRKLAVSGNGRTAVTGGGGGTLRVWDLADGKLLRETSPTANPWVDALAVDSEGHFALSISREAQTKTYAVQQWDLSTGAPLATLQLDAQVSSSSEFLTSAHFLASGPLVALNHKVFRWSVGGRGGQLTELFGTGGHTPELAATPTGKLLVCTGGRTPTVWSLADNRLVRSLHGHTTQVTTAATFGVRFEMAVTGGYDGAVRVWDLNTGDTTLTLLGHQSPVTTVSVESGGSTALSGDRDGCVRVWSLARRGPSTAFLPLSQRSIKGMSRDSRLLLASDRQELVLYSVDAGRQIRRWSAQSSGGGFSGDLAPDGRSAITVDLRDGTLRQWDLDTGRRQAEQPGFGSPYLVRYFSDGKTVAVATTNGTLWLWAVNSLSPPTELARHDARISAIVPFSDGSAVIAGDYKGRITIHAVASHDERQLGAHRGIVESLSVSADGKMLLSSGADRTIRVWDLQSMREVRSWVAGRASVKSVALFPDEQLAMSVDMEAVARFWDVTSGRELVRTAPGSVFGSSTIKISSSGLIALLDQSESIQLWDIAYPARSAASRGQAADARQLLSRVPNDPWALAALGTWMATAGPDTWAVDLLEHCRTVGGTVSPKTLGDCYWRSGRRGEAAAEYRKALASARDDDERFYLRTCLRALDPPPQ